MVNVFKFYIVYSKFHKKVFKNFLQMCYHVSLEFFLFSIIPIIPINFIQNLAIIFEKLPQKFSDLATFFQDFWQVCILQLITSTQSKIFKNEVFDLKKVNLYNTELKTRFPKLKINNISKIEELPTEISWKSPELFKLRPATFQN